ncbi:T9SS type A sorting domain-containing protein, partial [Bacteroidales bacterium OttesenSCG-928-I21]|nr:T9SS type A sorting domain-containing protein [Bacteroidales bacterium OttesenSCG-928-I21]
VSPFTYNWVKKQKTVLGSPSYKNIISSSNTANIACDTEASFLEYALIVTDARGDKTTQIIPCCKKCKSKYEDFAQQEYSIYPNPSSTTFRINGILLADIQIFNALGDLVYSQNNILEDTEICSVNLVNGIYFVKISENNCIKMLKLIVDK